MHHPVCPEIDATLGKAAKSQGDLISCCAFFAIYRPMVLCSVYRCRPEKVLFVMAARDVQVHHQHVNDHFRNRSSLSGVLRLLLIPWWPCICCWTVYVHIALTQASFCLISRVLPRVAFYIAKHVALECFGVTWRAGLDTACRLTWRPCDGAAVVLHLCCFLFTASFAGFLHHLTNRSIVLP
jgi:hypothetical protein